MEVDRISQSVQTLDERGRQLTWSINNIEHCPERKAQIQHELGSIAFELWHRKQEGELSIFDGKLVY